MRPTSKHQSRPARSRRLLESMPQWQQHVQAYGYCAKRRVQAGLSVAAVLNDLADQPGCRKSTGDERQVRLTWRTRIMAQALSFQSAQAPHRNDTASFDDRNRRCFDGSSNALAFKAEVEGDELDGNRYQPLLIADNLRISTSRQSLAIGCSSIRTITVTEQVCSAPQ